MSDKTIDVRLKQRYDTEANWNSANPVLLEGEMAISSDKNGKYKVGNGTSTWKQLSYAKSDLQKSDITNALGYTPPTTDTTYATGTETISGITKLYQETGSNTDGTMTQNAISEALNGKATVSHTHNYAGSSTAGGSANSAVKLDSSAGTATQPVYFSGGKPVACTYTLAKSVPSDAVFTDTTYDNFVGISNADGESGLVPAPLIGEGDRFLYSGGGWVPITTGKIKDLSVSAHEINCLGGVTANVQGQLNGKAPSDHTHELASVTSNGFMSIEDKVKLDDITVMGGCSASAAGKSGLVPKPPIGYQSRYLRGDATWGGLASTSGDGLMSKSHVTQINNLESSVNQLNTNIAAKIEVGDFSVSAIRGELSYTNGWGNLLISVAKSGKKAIGVVGWSVSNSYFSPSAVGFDFSKQTASITLRHQYNEKASGSGVPVYFAILYINT